MLFGVLFVLFAFVLSIALPTWLSVGAGSPASKTVTALTENKEVRDEAARFFIEKLTEGAPAEDLARFDELESTISTKLDELVANDEFMAKVGEISDEVYDFFVNGVDETQVVQAKAVVGDLVDALVEVDPEFSNLQQEVDDWKGLELEPMNEGPDLKSIKDGLTSLFWIALLLTLAAGALYARWSRSKRGALLFAGITAIVLGAIDLVAAGAVRSAVVSSVDETDRFANAAVPVVADSLLSPFRTIGTVWIVLGFISIASGVVIGRRATVGRTQGQTDGLIADKEKFSPAQRSGEVAGTVGRD
ncbi:MAG: hypothetical protein RLZZ199_726 [Actinomycetota bacterium]